MASPNKTVAKNTLRLLTAGALTATVGCSGGAGSSASLDPRFEKSGSVEFIQDGNSVMSADYSSFASGLSISLALGINAPLTTATDGTQLYASDLRVYGNKVITAYNVPGNTQKGWIDLIDVTTLAVPLLVSSQYLPDTDVNSLAMNNGNFALVGAKDNVGAVLRTGTFNALGMTLSSTETSIPSYAGNGAAFDGTGAKLAVTSGDSGAGGLSLLTSSTLSTLVTRNNGDTRAVTYHAGQNKFYTVTGGTGGNTATVYAYDINGNQTASRVINGATIPESKSTITARNEFLLATSGDGGFTVLCASDLGIAATQGQYIYSGAGTGGVPASTSTVTNAAAFGPGMIFVAAGQAGVRVYNFVKKIGTSPTACQNIQVSYMGYFEFSTSLSANNLVYANVLTTILTYTGVLYVAEGGGGFKAVTVVATKSALNDIIDF